MFYKRPKKAYQYQNSTTTNDMPNQNLNITLIQPDIVWEDKPANLKNYTNIINSITTPKQVVVMPEMFATGFSMNAVALAEPMSGPTLAWMAETAVKHNIILTGSAIIEEDGKIFNRLLWVRPDGAIEHYDKKHLFAYANEDKHYSPGDRRVIVQVNGWRINLLVCYDLRFPVWARCKDQEDDAILYVANWPQQRSLAWRTLIQARAIENQSYVIGVNRVGTDNNGNQYIGDSMVIQPNGEIKYHSIAKESYDTITLLKDTVESFRNKFPFSNDADKFLLI